MNSYRGADSDARLTTVAKLAADLGVTGSQLVLAWLLRQRDPDRVVLIGPRTLAQYDSALAASDIHLDATTLAEMDGRRSLAAAADQPAAPR